MPDTRVIFLRLCEPCKAKALDFHSPRQVEGWTVLPEFCPQCSAKVAQCVRILVMGGSIIYPVKRSE